MESILARALEYTLKYWLKSFSRDQFKLQGRTVQLSNLDINGDVLHASLGLPPAINVATAKIGKLEIKLPYVSNVQVEPIVVQIDKLDLVLEENADPDGSRSSSSGTSTAGSGKGSGYGFADKIADGMTLEVGTVNLMLETRGGASRQGGAAWASPLASFTMRNLLLYTTNEHWQAVNLKEARDFSNEENFIYVFKKLEWESLSVDLLPHPDMFTEMDRAFSASGNKKRDNDGAKRVFFGGERFLDGISGQAYITVQRDELNSPLGLEVRLHVTEAVCPALSEPGLRALLRFMTGLYVCLNRGDVDPKAQKGSAEAAGRSLVSILVDHIFLCIKDSEFQLDLLMQSLFFSRASVSDGESTKNLTHVTIAGMFLRDTFSRPPCTLVQPSMQDSSGESPTIPNFGRDFCPPIYPLGDEGRKLDDGVPLICLHTLQIKPSPQPPLLASQTVIFCQPLVINLQEESCLRITSFLADGVVVNPGVVLPDFSVNSLKFTLKEFDLIVPLSFSEQNSFSSFSGAKLHVENFLISESPAIKFQLLNLEKDPACFCLWDGQPLDSSQRKWAAQVSYLSLSLETSSSLNESLNDSRESWHCVELHEGCFEAAMVTNDGSPLITTPPSGGIVRIGFACEQYLSNTSTEQLFFILDLYTYFGRISEEIAIVRKGSKINILEGSPESGLLENAPSDTAVSLAIGDLQLKFIESSDDVQGIPLVHFGGEDLFVKVTHRTLGGAIAVSSSLCWKSVHVDCVTTEATNGNDIMGEMPNGFPHMRAVFWVDHRDSSTPFLDITTVHVMPYHAKDMECHSLTLSARLAGVRLGGGMNYTEALLHRFGILGPDGGPGEGLSKGLQNLSAGPLSKILKASPLAAMDGGEGDSLKNGEQHPHLELGKPDDVDISIELRDWSFALEGVNEMEGYLASNRKQVDREEKSWHTTFHSLQMKAKSTPIETNLSSRNSLHGKKYPVELVTVSVEGLQAFKPHHMSDMFQNDFKSKNMNGVPDSCGGVNLEARVLLTGQDENQEISQWVVENIKFSVKQPIEAVATKEEIQHLAVLCRSEVESMGRLAAGIIRILDLDKSIGQAALDQLGSLGSDGVDKIFTPEKLSRRSSIGSMGNTPSLNFVPENPREGLEETIKLLEAAVSDSQAKCSALESQLDGFDKSVSGVDELKQRLESMHDLLMKLRTQV